MKQKSAAKGHTHKHLQRGSLPTHLRMDGAMCHVVNDAGTQLFLVLSAELLRTCQSMLLSKISNVQPSKCACSNCPMANPSIITEHVSVPSFTAQSLSHPPSGCHPGAEGISWPFLSDLPQYGP